MNYRDPYSWGGPSYPGYEGEMKGDSTAKAAESNQLAFTEELQNIFSSQFNTQSDLLRYVTRQAKNIVGNPQGYSPAALAAMRANATDTIARQFQGATRALNERELATGGADLPSGVNAQLDAGLYAEEASRQAEAHNEITLQNENERQQNYWRALGVLSGNSELLNPTPYATNANEGTKDIAALSEANTQANNSGFLHTLGSSFATTLGHTLGGGNAGEGGGGVSGFFGN